MIILSRHPGLLTAYRPGHRSVIPANASDLDCEPAAPPTLPAGAEHSFAITPELSRGPGRSPGSPQD